MYWLNNGEHFDKATMVECFVTIVTSALKGAHALDADLNVDAAIEALSGDDGAPLHGSTHREKTRANGRP